MTALVHEIWDTAKLVELIAQPDLVLAGPFRGTIVAVDRKHRLCLPTEDGVDHEIPTR